MSFIIIFFILFLLILLLYRPDKTLTQLKEKYDFTHSHALAIMVDNQRININYTDEGNQSNHAIILLHGMFSSLQTFDEWTKLLLDKGYRVIRIDLPNHGASGSFSDQFISLRRSASIVKSLINHLDIHELSIGGNSMGGGVSWYFAAKYGQEFNIRHLILIDSISPLQPYGERNKWREFMMSTFIGKQLSHFTPKFLFGQMLKVVYGSKENISQTTINRYYDFLLLDGNRHAIITSKQEPVDDLTSIKALERIQSSSIKTLIMWGKLDRLIPISTLNDFQCLINDERTMTKIYDTLGHVPMEEDPHTTFIDLYDFISK